MQSSMFDTVVSIFLIASVELPTYKNVFVYHDIIWPTLLYNRIKYSEPSHERPSKMQQKVVLKNGGLSQGIY